MNFTPYRQLINKRNLVFLFLAILLTISPNLAFSQESGSKKEEQFKIKGFHLDLRIQIMKPEALHDLAKDLADFGINTLIMEWEATFPYETHSLISNRYAYTREEISNFISYCNALDIDVIPLQQSFGHLEYILRHYRYADLREDQKDVSQVCPLEVDLNRQLFTDLFTEMAAMHSSEYFHIGGDETYLLGKCDRCAEYAGVHGKSSLYVEHIKMLCDIVIGLGKRPVLWADIGLKYPAELSELPKETIFVDWNYGWKLNHFGDVNLLASSGFEVWGAPSLRSSPDNYYLSTWDVHFKNLKNFIPAGRELGYKGMILTSWSTSGRYSTIFESRWKIIDLIPIRRVYPLTASRISMAAFISGINSVTPLNQETFLEEYCKNRYGFTKEETETFWSALTAAPYQVDNGKVLYKDNWTITMLLDKIRSAIGQLDKLNPKTNKEEFEHYRLMMDIRENYLCYKEIEQEVNAESFKQDQLTSILSNLEDIIKKGKQIDKRFIKLNEDRYYKSELESENQNRNLPARLLYARLNKER